MDSYHPFLLRVRQLDPPDTGLYEVTAQFQGVERSDNTNLSQITEQDLTQASNAVRDSVFSESRASDLGERLFRTLFPPAIAGMLLEAEQRLGPNEQIRIVLMLPLPGKLAEVPWELMYDATGGHGYLARSRSAPLVRCYTNVPFPHPLPSEKEPLRVLIVTASPKGRPPVTTAKEIEAIKASLNNSPSCDRLKERSQWRHPSRLLKEAKRLLRGRRYEITTLENATRRSLQKTLNDANNQDKGFHVLHFIGHASNDGGYAKLYLFDPDNDKGDAVSAAEFAGWLQGDDLNLVFLNACETATTAPTYEKAPMYENLARAIVGQKIPAVIGMQIAIFDQVAVDFARDFYRAWSAGEPIESATAYARRLVRPLGPGDTVGWSIPILFMGQTGGLTIPAMKSANSWLGLSKRTIGFFGTVIFLLGVLMMFMLDVPEATKTARLTYPIVQQYWPYPMSSEHNFNIVVAPLPVVDAERSPVNSGDGKALAEFLYQRLLTSFADLDLATPYEIRGPDHTAAIKGDTPELRREAAARLAEQIDAHIVIYGQVVQAGDDSRYKPEMFVNYKGFDQEQQIVGPYALGSDLYLDLPFEAERYQGVRKLALSERMQALSLIAIGIAHYFSDDPQGALPYFKQAAETEGWSRKDEGKAVIYAFIGHTYVSMATRDFDEAAIEEAERYYDLALARSPNFARAQTGKAEILYLQGRSNSSDLEMGGEKLLEAIKAFEAVLALEDPDLETLRPKIWFSIGRANWQLYDADEANGGEPLAEATQSFTKVVGLYAETKDPQLAELAGHADGYLGVIAERLGDAEEAQERYWCAIQNVSPRYQGAYYSLLGDLYRRQDDYELARDAYEHALRIAVFYADDSAAEMYEEKIDDLPDKAPEQSGSAAEPSGSLPDLNVSCFD